MIDETKLNEIIFSKQTVEFVTASNEFCALVESASAFERKDFIEKSQKLLALLYFKGAVLVQPKNVTEEEVEKFVGEEDWLYVKNGVSDKLGEKEIFGELFEPLNEEEPVNVSLSECFADIYQDLKDFVKLYEFGNPESVNEGLWECVENFQQIWGPRLLFVMKELHNMLFGNYDMVETEKKETDENPEQKQTRDWLDKNFFNK